MTAHEIAVVAAWRKFLVARPATHAVTLSYNPHRAGTASPCYRITSDGECLRLYGSGVPAVSGVNRLSAVRHIPLEQVHRDFDGLHRKVDRKLFGSRFNHLPEDERSGFAGYIEHATSNLHAHLAWRVPDARADEFTEVITDAWMDMNPFASIRVKLIRDDGWAKYLAKDVRGAALDGDAALFVASRPARS